MCVQGGGEGCDRMEGEKRRQRERERNGMNVWSGKGIEIVMSGSCHFFLNTCQKGPSLARLVKN